MFQEGEIDIAECRKCKEVFPVFIFTGDTDMITIGCIALTGVNKDIVLTQQKFPENQSEIEGRIGPGYKIVDVRYVNNSKTKAGMSFQAFRKAYKPPTPIYTCIYCGSDSIVKSHESKEQFLKHGEIRVMNDN